MGNRVSVAQDESDEAEYNDLVRAVEIAHGRARINDLEAGWSGTVLQQPPPISPGLPTGQDVLHQGEDGNAVLAYHRGFTTYTFPHCRHRPNWPVYASYCLASTYVLNPPLIWLSRH